MSVIVVGVVVIGLLVIIFLKRWKAGVPDEGDDEEILNQSGS